MTGQRTPPGAGTAVAEEAPREGADARRPGRTRLPVSVVIPCYRCAETIERAVASVAGQSAPPSELLLVEDGSGDDTAERLEDVRARYGPDWIRIVSLAGNGGPSVARNAGWEEAAQPFVAFLDADDAWHPRKLAIQYGWMARHADVALTSGPFLWVKPGRPPAELPREWSARRIGALRLLLSNCSPACTMMFRRDVPFRFSPGKRHSEDYLIALQVVLSGRAAYRLDIPLTHCFKAAFGAGGLTGDLWKMERGELDTYWRIRRSLPAWWAALPVLFAYSGLKFLSRLLRIRLFGTRAVRARSW